MVVTGGCGGIGSAFVHRFVNDGAFVAIVDNCDSSKVFAIVAPEDAPKVKFYHCDISSQGQCIATVKTIQAHFGKINHLINSVAYFGSKGLEATEADWAKTMAVNVAGFSHMAQACYQHMKKISQQEPCSIVNLSSISAHKTQPDRWTYAASKGAVNILTKSMAYDMGKDKIRVNSISPSWTWTPEVSKIDPEGK